MRLIATAALAAIVAVYPASAQIIPTPAPAAQPAFAPQSGQSVMRALILTPNTDVTVTPNDTINTKSARVGDKIPLSTMYDVMQDGFVVIPRGTRGEGTITYRTGKGAFGKSGKMEISFDWLDVGGHRIPLTGKHREEGEGNTGAAVGAVVAVGIFGGFVTGHSATITNGQSYHAHTVDPVTFYVPGAAAPMVSAVIAPTVTAAQPTPVQAVMMAAPVQTTTTVAPVTAPRPVAQPAAATANPMVTITPLTGTQPTE